MRTRSIRFLLGMLTVVFAGLLVVPLATAQAAPKGADVKSGETASGEVGAEAIIPGRCEYTSSQPTVSIGSSGNAVRQVQCEYNWATTGTNIAIDGQFGPITRSAIIRFQGCVGIATDGVVGPITWSHLNYWAASNYYPPGC